MRIVARLQEMAEADLLEMIPANIYTRIKAKDDKPMFRAYVVGHEGESEGYLVGIGNRIKRWFKSTIQTLHEKLQFGTRVFNQHNADNSHVGREPIGEVVGKMLKNLGGRLTTIAAIYVKPEFRHLPLDVASIECDVEVDGDDENADVVAVHDITGVALGNSRINRPGFPGATLLAQLQAFSKNSSKSSSRIIGGQFMTVQEIQEAISALKLKASDLFTREDLVADPFIKGHVTDEIKTAVAGEYSQRKRNAEKFDADKKELEDKLAKAAGEVAELKKTAAKANVPAWLEKAKTDRKLSDVQLKYINARLPKFSPSDPDKAETEFGKFLDSEIDEFKKTAEILGIGPANGGGDGEGDKKLGGEPDEKNKGGNVGADKYLDPGQNEFIKVDGGLND